MLNHMFMALQKIISSGLYSDTPTLQVLVSETVSGLRHRKLTVISCRATKISIKIVEILAMIVTEFYFLMGPTAMLMACLPHS